MSEDTPATANGPAGAEHAASAGHLVVRLGEHPESDHADLLALAEAADLHGVRELLRANPSLRAARVIRHISPAQLRERERVATTTGFAPRVSLGGYWRIDAREGMPVARLREAFAALPEVDIAYVDPPVVDPGASLPPVDGNPYLDDQGYLDAAPKGIGARHAWPHAVGDQVCVIDLEDGWILEHEDLPAPTLLYGDNRRVPGSAETGDHGAAALSIVAGVDNALGVLGVTPRLARLDVVSHYRADDASNLHVADAIGAAAQHLSPGDVLLLEVQRVVGGKMLPTEVVSSDLHAIIDATAQGIIVIEAAGNDGTDLGSWVDADGEHALDPADSRFVDSGAILVGASQSMVIGGPQGDGHIRYYTSNYGARVDCYAWGEQVCAAGYGGLQGAAGGTDSYTRSFGQTSAAAAIIAGAAALLQSWHVATHGVPLTPEQMRAVLSDPTRGTRQVPDAAEPVGVMPDLSRLIADCAHWHGSVPGLQAHVQRGPVPDPFAHLRKVR